MGKWMDSRGFENFLKLIRSQKLKSMMKKMTAQRTDPGRLRTRSGYVRKTRPGPELTTSWMVVSWTWAMYPRMEKTRTPASRQVSVLTMQVMMASLQK